MEVNGENEDITIDVAVVVTAAVVVVAVEMEVKSGKKLEISHVFMVVVMNAGVLSTEVWDSFVLFLFC